MGSSIVGLALLLTGINVGWEKTGDGGYVYIIQIEPETLDALKAGLPIESHLEPRFRGIRSYRIVVGKGEVPREGMPDMPEKPTPKPFPITEPAEASPLKSAGKGDSGAQQTAFYQGTEAAKATPEPGPVPDEESKPWKPLVIVLALLLGSISGNLYLGWITWDTRGRYRRLLRRAGEQPQSRPEVWDSREVEEEEQSES